MYFNVCGVTHKIRKTRVHLNHTSFSLFLISTHMSGSTSFGPQFFWHRSISHVPSQLYSDYHFPLLQMFLEKNFVGALFESRNYLTLVQQVKATSTKLLLKSLF